MDWGLIVTLPTTVAFGIATIVLALKLAKRKKPVWAYKTTKIIGLGTNAPPELKLTFSDRPVNDVYQTTFILFNKGTEAIRRGDVTESVTMHFQGAEILRQPIIKAKSKEAIEFSAEQVVKDGDNSIQLGFLYLDHNDGAVVDVLHTEGEDIRCSGNMIGAKEIANIGEFAPFRTERFRSLLAVGAAMLLMPLLGSSFLMLPESRTPAGLALLPISIIILSILMLSLWFVCYMSAIRPFFRYRIFPKWSRIKE
ncbi:MAG: hypothetical protein E3J67_01375 [Dehalococcoidia bacterium]|nr:MAG: hypothetical protein E3J67_01375 [Dehalococcoidia bacterium]